MKRRHGGQVSVNFWDLEQNSAEKQGFHVSKPYILARNELGEIEGLKWEVSHDYVRKQTDASLGPLISLLPKMLRPWCVFLFPSSSS